MQSFEGGEETVFRLGPGQVDFGQSLGQLPHLILVLVFGFVGDEVDIIQVHFVVLMIGLLRECSDDSGD
jgi:hypothetical protein